MISLEKSVCFLSINCFFVKDLLNSEKKTQKKHPRLLSQQAACEWPGRLNQSQK